LERRLYHSAASLAEYNDRTTLKQRLLELVREIAVQHQESRNFDHTVSQIQKQQQLPGSLLRTSYRSSRGGGGSVTSQSSIESSSVMSQRQQSILNRSSFVSTTSIDSLRDLRESVDTKAIIESVPSNVIPLSRSRASSVGSKRSVCIGDENDDAVQRGNTSIDKKLKESTDVFEMPAPRQRVRSTKGSTRSSTTSRSNPNSRTNSVATESISNSNTQPHPITTEEHRQQQKLINQTLQEQILDNIRLQEEIVRKLQQTEQQLMNTSSQNHGNVAQNQQQFDPLLSMYMNTNDFASNKNNNNSNNNNNNLGGHGMLLPNGIVPSSSSAAANGLNMGLSHQPTFPQQQLQQQFTDYNNSLNPSPMPLQQPQQPQQPNFLPNNSNIRYNDVESVRNQLLMQRQQQQQQQQQSLSFGGVGSQFQQNQYNALLQQQQQQQQQLTSLPGLQGSISGITNVTNINNNLGMGQHHLLQNFPNINNSFTPQPQPGVMQMPLMNRSMLPSLSNTSVPHYPTQQQQPLPMNAVPENTSMLQMNNTSSIGNTANVPDTERSNASYEPLDSNDTMDPLDTSALDWWK
jgi:hypothetical protein